MRRGGSVTTLAAPVQQHACNIAAAQRAQHSYGSSSCALALAAYEKSIIYRAIARGMQQAYLGSKKRIFLAAPA